MHFYFTIYTKQQLDIANITHNIYQIVLHLPNCASPKIRGCVPSSRFCWWQKREQSTDAFSSIKSKPYFFKNNTLLSTKQHVVFNKTTRYFQQNNTLFSIKRHVTFWKRHVTFNKDHLLLNAHLKMAHIKHLVIKRKKTNYFLSTFAHTHAYTHT